MIEEFTPLIKIYIFAVASRPILCKEMNKPLERGSLRDSSIAMFYPSEVVCNKDPAGFSVDSFIIYPTIAIF